MAGDKFGLRPATEKDIIGDIGRFNNRFSRLSTDNRLSFFNDPDKYLIAVVLSPVSDSIIGFAVWEIVIGGTGRFRHPEIVATGEESGPAPFIKLFAMDLDIHDKLFQREATRVLVDWAIKMGEEKGYALKVVASQMLERFYEDLGFKKTLSVMELLPKKAN